MIKYIRSALITAVGLMFLTSLSFAVPNTNFVIGFTVDTNANPQFYADVVYDSDGNIQFFRCPKSPPGDAWYHNWSEVAATVSAMLSTNIPTLPSNVAYLNVPQSGNLNVSTITIGNSTNSASFLTGNTNWTDGQVYVNQTGRNVWVEAPCLMTPALLAGNSVYSLVVSNSSTDILTNSSAAPSLLALLIPANPGFVCGIVKPNGYWWFTNKSTAGTAVMNGKGQYEIR